MSARPQVVRQILPAEKGWHVASPIEHADYVEVWLDPIVAWACHASYVDGHDIPTLTNSDPIIGGEMWADQPDRAIRRPDGKYVIPEEACLDDKAALIAWWRDNGMAKPLSRGAGQ